MKKLLFASCALLCFCLPSSSQVVFHQFKDPLVTWANAALSARGDAMALNIGGEIYRWTAATGFVDLGAGDPFNASIGISGDGNTVVSGHVGPDGNTNPGMWQQGSGWMDLGHPAEGCLVDGNWGDAWSTNRNGSIIVGLSWYCPGAEGFQWTPQQGMVGLGYPPSASSRATAISQDGSTIVGFYEDPTQGFRRPVRWISGSTDLFVGSDVPGEAIGVSSDGSQIVGQAADDTGNGRAFYYTSSGGLIDLGVLGGNKTYQSVAIGLSDNGIVIGTTINPFNWSSQPFVWTSHMGLRSMQAAFFHNGAVIPSGLSLSGVLAISSDGSTIVGLWTDANLHQGLWMAHLHRKALLNK